MDPGVGAKANFILANPGGLSALGDQELAAGVMIGIGAIPFSVAVFVLIYQWLDEERPRRSRRRLSTTA